MVETNQFSPKYPVALKNGWKVGATGYGDGHLGMNSGSRRYGVLATELTKDGIKNAMKQRRSFGVTEGRSGSSVYPLAVALKVNEVLMGGIARHNGTIDYQVYVKDSIKNIDKVKLWYGGNYSFTDRYLVGEFNNLGGENLVEGSFYNFAFDMPQRAKFVYAEVFQKDGSDNLTATAWTSPVWLRYDDSITPISTPTTTPPLTLTPTPTPGQYLNCETSPQLCYFGQSQCSWENRDRNGGRCVENPTCGDGPYWNWSYCYPTTGPTPTSTPITTPPLGPTPTLVPTVTPTPGGLNCEPRCSFGKYQCNRDNADKTGGRCRQNVEDCGEGLYWNWSYCYQ